MIEIVCGLILECRTRRYPLPAIRDSYLNNKGLFVSEGARDELCEGQGFSDNKCLQLVNALVEMKHAKSQDIRRFNVEEVSLEFNTAEDCRCVQSHYV